MIKITVILPDEAQAMMIKVGCISDNGLRSGFMDAYLSKDDSESDVGFRDGSIVDFTEKGFGIR